MRVPGRIWRPEKLWRIEVSNWVMYRDGKGGFEWVSEPAGPTTWIFRRLVDAISFAARRNIDLH